jgi:hypothetical protein
MEHHASNISIINQSSLVSIEVEHQYSIMRTILRREIKVQIIVRVSSKEEPFFLIVRPMTLSEVKA